MKVRTWVNLSCLKIPDMLHSKIIDGICESPVVMLTLFRMFLPALHVPSCFADQGSHSRYWIFKGGVFLERSLFLSQKGTPLPHSLKYSFDLQLHSGVPKTESTASWNNCAKQTSCSRLHLSDFVQPTLYSRLRATAVYCFCEKWLSFYYYVCS